MIRRTAIALFAVILSLAALPARAQLIPIAVTSPAGSANAQTGTVANASSYADLLNVLLEFTPTATNTSTATLSLSGLGGVLSGGPIAFKKPNGSGLTPLIGGELVTGQPVLITYDGSEIVLMGPVNLPVGAAALLNSALNFGVPVNLGLSGTVSANALTIAVKGIDGNDPSPSNPVLAPFRNATIATGTPTVISLQAALSLTIASTSTMGCVSAQMCRIWIVLINDGGNLAVCGFNARNTAASAIAPINEAALQTSASGTTGGSSAQTYYCSRSAVAAKAIRIVGYLDIQEATAGTWASGPTYVQLFGPGIKKPGDVVQGPSFAQMSNVVTIGTSPTQTSITASITVTAAANGVEATAIVNGDNGLQHGCNFQLSRGTSPTLFGFKAESGGGSSATMSTVMPMYGLDFPNVATGQAYYVFGSSDINGGCSTQDPGMITLKEIMGAIEPANDDGPPLAMAG